MNEKKNTHQNGSDLNQLEKEVDAYRRLLQLTEDELSFKDSQINALENVLDYYSQTTFQNSSVKKGA